MAEEKWIKITKDTELCKGDIVELDFVLMSLFDWDVWYGVQMDIIGASFEKDPRLTLLSISYPQEKLVTFKVRVDRNPMTAAVIIALVLGSVAGMTLVWLTFREVRLLVRESGPQLQKIIEQTGWTGFKVGVAVLIATVGFIWLKSA